jgi:hypothetical protein
VCGLRADHPPAIAPTRRRAEGPKVLCKLRRKSYRSRDFQATAASRSAWTGTLRARASPNAHRRAFNDPCDPSTPTTIRPLCCGPSAEASGCGDDRPVLAIGSLWVRGRREGHSALGDCYERERDRRGEYRPLLMPTDSSGLIAWLGGNGKTALA